MNVSRFLRSIGAWAIIAFFLWLFAATSPPILASLSPLVARDNLTYDDKLHIKWGGYYDLMHFAAQQTPETAVILMDNTARVELDLYFLYPRRLFYGGEQDLKTHPEIDYALVTDNFPDFAVKCDRRMMTSSLGICKILR